ncbi:4-alpha-glucanotransferase [Demequina lignilytica]|uniref:4-alpha-glucanotransferase n=1 Tax=Demequina lignilytica TaxID=3051663 RepID=A0AAW7M4E0_9MICO|nr:MULTISPECIES: 4-alpha-glucanotransferase [unclassified Demequina]MDN4479265.1 4-alpha-glucanotransferase [Demequina sp. SYSU T00039-1]MDN4483099.1 4-alpha-glucanotransferase [Demequina sp. SYSU T0a273]MDN4487583.1 4-alpha-glucanotransferase [Demequina sp. SYSU T00039]
MNDAPEVERELPSEALAALARACRVSVEYYAIDGTLVQCSAPAIRAALAAMGVDAGSDVACERSLEALEDLEWSRLVPPVVVVTAGDALELPVHVDDGDEVDVTLRLESGETREMEQLDRWVPPREVAGTMRGRATFLVPPDLPLGWHVVEAVSGGRRGRGHIVIAPAQVEIDPAIRAARPWGLTVQLYSLRSERSWGVGDLADLADLCALGKARAEAEFVLVNPLHATEPVAPITNSPYLPTSKRFLSPLYIRVEDIPEVAYLPSQQRALLAWEAEKPQRLNESDELLDRNAVWRLKSAALEEVFKAPRSAGRDALFEQFCLREGAALEDFATWCAISEAHRGLPWPDEFDSPTSAAVAAWRDEHADRVLYYAWLQWIADEQLERAQAAATRAGMSIGVMVDLAVGVHPEGADAWSSQRVLAQGISLGVPPDYYNAMGQDWSIPPWQPRALEAAAYLPFRDMVRAAARHAGALRIDHVLGMFRQWWVPAGHPPLDGAYVYLDHEALIGIIALEAQRAGTIVIGEDLGTVEPWVRDYLHSRGILGTSIVWFERHDDGAPRLPEDYRADTLAAVTTHDLPPTPAYLAGEHVTLRAELGMLGEGGIEAAQAEAERERQAYIDVMLERGWILGDYNEEDLVAGLHRWVLDSPSLLTGVAITDAVGDRRAQNMPGTDTEYPNWCVPITDGNGEPVLLDDLFEHPRVRRLFRAIKAARS